MKPGLPALLKSTLSPVFCVLFGIGVGCAPPPKAVDPAGSPSVGQFFSQCRIPPDQAGTLSGSWPASPIPVALSHLSPYSFDSTETAAIKAAMDTWNTFFKNSTANKNPSLSQIFYYGSPQQSAPQTASTPPSDGSLCTSTGSLQGNQFAPGAAIVIYKQTQTWNYPPGAIAITNFCTTQTSNSPIPRMYTAAMNLNYVHFFVASPQNPNNRNPDLQSIVLHELGHLLGMNHSCQTGSATAGFPSCSQPNLNSLYLGASLFPIFNFSSTGMGEVRQNLNQNDQERANCLYPFSPQVPEKRD